MSHDMPEIKASLIEHFSKTPIVEVVCKQTGIGRSTYYRWRSDDSEFADACDDAIEQSTGLINDMAESQLISAIKEKNMTGIIFWLKNHHPAYETRVRLGGKLTLESEELTDEQEALVTKALALAGLLKGEK
jgi:hypothetical protein